MIERRHQRAIMCSPAEAPAVVLLGPRQVGGTALAHEIARDVPYCMYLDLEDPDQAARLANPELYLDAQSERMLILDEIQRMPNLFQVLRGQIDKRCPGGQSSGQFLLLGSASKGLFRQAAESLAGRATDHEPSGLDALEIGGECDHLWVRGGAPDSFRASDDETSARWRTNFVRTYLERDIPQLGGLGADDRCTPDGSDGASRGDGEGRLAEALQIAPTTLSVAICDYSPRHASGNDAGPDVVDNAAEELPTESVFAAVATRAARRRHAWISRSSAALRA